MSMHVIGLTAENFKRLVAVDITPNGGVQIVAGANAQGKTSVLDAIWAALGGAKASPERPIRDGADEAKVVLDLGEIKVTRTWRGEKTSLTVENAAGGRLPSPQAVLDSLVGKITFDPLAFAEADDKTQLKMLLEVVQLPFDPEQLAAKRRAYYEDRAAVNRDVKRLQGVVDSSPRIVPAVGQLAVPAEEISVAELAQQLAAKRAAQGRYDQLRTRYNEIQTQIENLRIEAEQLNSEGRDLATSLSSGYGVEQLEEQLEAAEAINAAVRANKARADAEAQLRGAKGSSDDLTEQIRQLDEYRAKAISEAAMPVPGLGFTDEGVTLNGVPFSQASGAERLRTSVAIAMAKNPQVRVILVRDGSLLDNSNMQVLAEMAAAGDYQIWIERVDENSPVGVIIEDGQVRS